MSNIEGLLATEPEPVEKTKPSILSFLTRRQKVAAILVAMDKQHASTILRHFSNEDLILLNEVAKTLPVLDAKDLEALVTEFENSFAEGNVLSEVGSQFSTLLKNALGEESAYDILNSEVKILSEDNIWSNIVQLAPEKLYEHIKDEHPQIFAYIFSRLPSDVASKLILLLPANERSDIIKRTLVMEPVSKNSEELATEILQKKLLRATNTHTNANYNQVAGVFNNLQQDQVRQILSELRDLDQNDLANIRKRLFIFEDMPRLSQSARIAVLSNISNDTIIAALANSTPIVREAILSAIATRSRRLIERELEYMSSIDKEEQMKARRLIAQTVINLANKNIITIS